LLANDLRSAQAVIKLDDPAHEADKVDDLLAFVTSERYARLRKQLGIAI
jgi:hypothetical protein